MSHFMEHDDHNFVDQYLAADPRPCPLTEDEAEARRCRDWMQHIMQQADNEYLTAHHFRIATRENLESALEGASAPCRPP